MALQYLNSLRSMKIKEVPAHVKPLLKRDKIKNAVENFFIEYKRKHIDTSSIKPLHHTLIGVGIFSYFVQLPHERRHLRHLKELEEGGHGHGH